MDQNNMITAFDQNWPVWSLININGQWYVAISEPVKFLVSIAETLIYILSYFLEF